MRILRYAVGVLVIAALALLAVQVATAEMPSPYFVYHIAADDAGNIYALVSGNESISNNIHVYAPDGREISKINTSGRQVQEIAFDGQGNLYLRDVFYGNGPDSSTQSIRKIDLSGKEQIIDSGSRVDNVILLGLAVSRDGTVYYGKRTDRGQYHDFSDQSLVDYCILRVSPDGNTTVAYAVNGSSGFTSLAVDASGTIYACDRITVTTISPEGNVSIFKVIGPEDSPVNILGSVMVGPDGYLYTAEYSSAINAGQVRKLDPNGTTLAQWTGCGPYKFITASSVAVDNTGRIYVADLHNQRIVWFTQDYRFGDDESQNLAGHGVLWGTIVHGYDYKTWAVMMEQQNNQGIPYDVLGIVFAGIVVASIIAVLLIKFFAAGKSFSMAGNIVVFGITAIVVTAIAFILVFLLWALFHTLFGFSYTDPSDRYISAALGSQLYSLFVVVMMAAGALTAYISRKKIADDKDALAAGALTGLCAAVAVSIAVLIVFFAQQLLTSDMAIGLARTVSDAPGLIFIFFILIATFAMPTSAAGAFITRRYMAMIAGQGSPHAHYRLVMAAASAIAIVLVALIAADFSSTYSVEPAVVVMFLLPLLVTIPVLAASIKWQKKTGTIPPGFAVLGISAVAIFLVPLAEVVLATLFGLL